MQTEPISKITNEKKDKALDKSRNQGANWSNLEHM